MANVAQALPIPTGQLVVLKFLISDKASQQQHGKHARKAEKAMNRRRKQSAVSYQAADLNALPERRIGWDIREIEG